MIGRIAWTFALVCVGAVSAVLQTDRQSELNPELAAAVPPILRSYAQRVVAVEAVKKKDPATGLAEAEALVRRRPMPAEHLTILALAQAKAGDVKAAGLTIQLAGKRGWREPLAQEAVLRLAFEAGDKPEAARRFAAMFRNGSTPDEKLIALAPQVLGDPSGRETFATIIAAAPLWHEQFFQRGARVLPPSVFAEVIDLALDRNAQFPCGHLNAAIAGLRQRDAAAADRLAAPAARRCG